MALNDLGVEVPAATDAFDPDGDMRDLGGSLAGRLIIPVANTTARNALATTLSPSASEPLYVHRADAPTYAKVEWTEDGATWRAVGEAMRLSVANVAALPVSAEFKGQRIYVEDIDAIAWYDDKTGAWQGFWKSYTPTVAGTASPTKAFSYLVRTDEMVEVRVDLTLTAAITAALIIDLPVTAHGQYTTGQADPFDGVLHYRDTSAGGANRVYGFVQFSTSTSFACNYNATVNTIGAVSNGTNSPFAAAWASSDTIRGHFVYRRA